MSSTLVDIFSVGGDEPNDGPQTLREVKLGAQPALLMLFTKQVSKVHLYYDAHQDIGGFFRFVGEGTCPYDQVNKKGSDYVVLPALDVSESDVKVLRIPTITGPGRLLTLVTSALRDPDIGNKLVLITRSNNRYTLVTKPIPETADIPVAVIEQAKQDIEDGTLSILDAFKAYTADELREVPHIKTRLTFGVFDV